MVEVPSGTFQDTDLPLLHEPKLNPTGTKCIVSVKYWDVKQQQLVWLGTRVLDRSDTISGLQARVRQEVGAERLVHPDGLANVEPLLVWLEELSADGKTLTKAISTEEQSATLQGLSITSGDILVLCEHLPPQLGLEQRDAWKEQRAAVVAAARAVTVEDRRKFKALPVDPSAAKASFISSAETQAAEVVKIVKMCPQFYFRPDMMLAAWGKMISIQMEKRESKPPVKFQMQFQRDLPGERIICDLAEYLGEDAHHVRVFQMNKYGVCISHGLSLHGGLSSRECEAALTVTLCVYVCMCMCVCVCVCVCLYV
jgi:hypothetical protein